MSDMYYYHAGVETSPGNIEWSEHTRRTQERADREARLMARRGGRPVVEYWRRDSGLHPRDADAVIGCDYVSALSSDEPVVLCGRPIQYDESGVGHAWHAAHEIDCPPSIQEEIEAEIIDGRKKSCDGFRASNGVHYRW